MVENSILAKFHTVFLKIIGGHRSAYYVLNCSHEFHTAFVDTIRLFNFQKKKRLGSICHILIQ